jgi:hypothetical protein
MILEINQISHAAELETDFFTERLMRISLFWYAYYSFSIMENGMRLNSIWSLEIRLPLLVVFKAHSS